MQAGVSHLVFSSSEDPTSGLPEDLPESQPGKKLAVFVVKAQVSVRPILSTAHFQFARHARHL